MRHLGVVRSLNSFKGPSIHGQTFFMIDVFLLTVWHNYEATETGISVCFRFKSVCRLLFVLKCVTAPPPSKEKWSSPKLCHNIV